MDKNAIKRYAIWARRELISRVSQKALQFGIAEDKIMDPSADSVNDHLLTQTEKSQRQALIAKVEKYGYERMMEETAYTWFNRFIALRFMEVNNYLPTHIRVFTDEENAFKPQILAEAIHLELDGLNMDKVYAYKNADKTDELYKYLLITQCNALNRILPSMFQKIEDDTELLFPDNILREGSVIEQMISMIPESDWTDQVQIIGWLYQYYNTEPKDQVFADLKKSIKISKENIPAATQLFTPDWIVRYMVENSLGRLWLEHLKAEREAAGALRTTSDIRQEGGTIYPELENTADDYASHYQSLWKYYLDEAKQEPEVEAQLRELRKSYKDLTPVQIKVIDPCMGSGHILVYMFDVLMQIYEAYGFTAHEAVASIIENNLYGLDIDDRAAQLAYFAVMMKARQYDSRFFRRGLQPHISAICESNGIASGVIDAYCNGSPVLREAISAIVDELRDAKEYGSILRVSPQDWAALYARFEEIQASSEIDIYTCFIMKELLPLVQVAEALAQKYDVVVTNPPYRGIGEVDLTLQDYAKREYPISKQDLSTIFMEKNYDMCKEHGLFSMINIPVWMILTTFTALRQKLYDCTEIINLIHIGRGVFGSDFGTVAFTIRRSTISGFKGIYKRLFDRAGDVGSEEQKIERFFGKQGTYLSSKENFAGIPGRRLVYWASSNNASAYKKYMSLSKYADVKKGISTADDKRFLRLWHEVRTDKFSVFSENKAKWQRLNKGGAFRRWYGNNEYVINWENNGKAIKAFPNSVVRNESYYFKNGLTWTYVTNYKLNVRYYENAVLAAAGPGIFPSGMDVRYILGLLNTKAAQLFANNVGGESITYEVGEVASIPVADVSQSITDTVAGIVESCVFISRTDWDSYETSWDFKRHPLCASKLTGAYAQEGTMTSIRLSCAYERWKSECEARFQQLKSHEEALNRIFIDVYGLQDELAPEVADRDVTVRRIFDGKGDVPESMKGNGYVRTKRDEIVSLISYAVGCMFGRYSLDAEGIAYAGGDFDSVFSRNQPADKAETMSGGKDYDFIKSGEQWVPVTFSPDADNIIPICDDEYFDGDIVGRFVEFVKTVYGEDTLEENLRFIAVSLGGSGHPREVIRSYFLTDFYADHLKTYQKRPIYWLFDSGKKGGFKALIYMHRYQPDTIARIRTDYVHEQQARYRTAIADLEQRIGAAATGERVKLNKQLAKLREQDAEIHAYEEKIHHLADQMISIDLDDGVKHNYARFAGVLANI